MLTVLFHEIQLLLERMTDKIMAIQIWVFDRHFLEINKVNLLLQRKTTKYLLPMLTFEFPSEN